MSRLWTTLKSVVGGVAREAETVVASSSPAVASSSAVASSPAVVVPTTDGILQGFATVKPHNPMIKFRFATLD